MLKQKLKNLLSFSAKRRITKITVDFLRLFFWLLQLIFNASASLGFEIKSKMPRKIAEVKEFLRFSSISDGNALEKRFDKPPIAVFFDAVPDTGKDSANVRMFQLLSILARFARVILVVIYRRSGDCEREKELNKIGVETIWAIDFETRFRRERFEAAILSYPLVADYMLAAVKRKIPAAKIIYDTVDVHFVRLEREAEIARNQSLMAEAARFKEIEIRLANAADAVWCVTENDKDFLQTVAPAAKIQVVPNIHEPQGRGNSFAARKDLMFIGSYAHRPNVDAVLYFLETIFPLVQAKLPAVKFYIVGGQPTEEIKQAASENVIVTGFAADVAPYFENCRVFVSPLRYGAGMKGKIGQAFSFGLPVVTTSIGAEGMNLTAGREALIADEPHEFARRILEVYDNERLWQNLSDNGYRFIMENYSPAAIEKKLRRLLAETLPDADFRLE